ncbi:hypothetical protein DFW101_3401 [Solidesulfovibrio carbinoliphilus subsp. oakridgensis]|uniref:Uncharacterized protein n=1 Tax=Solidesulfovibrio carbinoliphilus subsp. oakridgensis TaxID=694327 RepID=G7QBH6_9BACT|nr:hypothetical protein [Solidesulfovibrio carbinoliphilus]EHJ49399.1 hypothetical protein DFW101_3401 [Solidesulfovibrio carbinoliphilus subsp. oakridgensis]
MDTPQDNDATEAKAGPSVLGGFGMALSDREKKNLLTFLSIGVILVEFAVTIAAVCYGIINSQKLPDGTIQFRFPWIPYAVALILAPVAIMFVVNIIGMGFTRFFKGEPAMDEEHMRYMPERLRRLISLSRGLPTIILLGGMILLGAALYYLDAVIQMLLRIGDHVEVIAPWVMLGLVAAWCLSYLVRMWFLYKTRRMQEEYAFRREVLERTGIVIVDGRKHIAADGRTLGAQNALPGRIIDVLPPGESDTDKDVS